MSRRSGGLGLLVVAGCVWAPAVAAQALEPRRELLAGAELRTISFEHLPSLKRLRQLSFPAGVVLAFRRLSIDIGTAYVSTELERVDSSEHAVNHLTDTQLRGNYVFGRDAIVATLLLNLPTGPRNASPQDYSVVGAVSPALLGFPVASYANGFSATAGLAAAIPAGSWSFGIAASVRMSSQFTPYVDSTGPITYKPGVEGRIRGGADGLVGASRLSFGFTYSTFGDDEFGSGTTGRGAYRPGPRWTAEAALVAPIGASSLNLAVWNFHRTAGDTTGVSIRNRENLAAGELSLSVPIGRNLALEPGVSARFSKPELGRGRLFGAGTGLRILLAEHLTLIPTARLDTGWIEDDQGKRSDISGLYASAFLRVTF